MKFFNISLLAAFVFAEDISDSLKKHNEDVYLDTKKFWGDQFEPWEQSGFTKEMIQGGRDIYFSKEWSEKMFFKHSFPHM